MIIVDDKVKIGMCKRFSSLEVRVFVHYGKIRVRKKFQN